MLVAYQVSLTPSLPANWAILVTTLTFNFVIGFVSFYFTKLLTVRTDTPLEEVVEVGAVAATKMLHEMTFLTNLELTSATFEFSSFDGALTVGSLTKHLFRIRVCLSEQLKILITILISLRNLFITVFLPWYDLLTIWLRTFYLLTHSYFVEHVVVKTLHAEAVSACCKDLEFVLYKKLFTD